MPRPENESKQGWLSQMSVADLADDARDIARALESRERQRGKPVSVARQGLASKLGVAPGTLENVRRGRLKDPLRLKGIVARLKAAMLSELNQEIARLEHERSLLLATGVDPRSDEMQAVATDIARARKTLGLEV